ncbi:MAG: hypothetical protein N2555_01350, partial [Endomicrobia bacterium]|nr:hypothetical protein [Endomicrobiia bacterium]
MKKTILAILLALLVGYMYAANPDSFEVSVTPVVNYSVQISTPAGGLDFGARELNNVYVLTTSATIRNNGNVRADWTVKATALNTWSLGSTLTDNGLDKAVLAALLNSGVPSVSDYTDSDVLTTTEKDA